MAIFGIESDDFSLLFDTDEISGIQSSPTKGRPGQDIILYFRNVAPAEGFKITELTKEAADTFVEDFKRVKGIGG